MTCGDRPVEIAAAKEWSRWEFATSTLRIPASTVVDEDELFALQFGRIESHYFAHGAFWEVDDQLLRDVGKLAGIPCAIAQGRYDSVCPMKSAYDLVQAWPASSKPTLVVGSMAGHSPFEPELLDALLGFCDSFKKFF